MVSNLFKVSVSPDNLLYFINLWIMLFFSLNHLSKTIIVPNRYFGSAVKPAIRDHPVYHWTELFQNDGLLTLVKYVV